MTTSIHKAFVLAIAMLFGVAMAGEPGAYGDEYGNGGMNRNGDLGVEDTVDTLMNGADTTRMDTVDTLMDEGNGDTMMDEGNGEALDEGNGETWGEPRGNDWDEGEQNGETWGEEDDMDQPQGRADEADQDQAFDIMPQQRPTQRFGAAGAGAAGLSNLGTEDELAYNAYAGGVWEVNPFAQLFATGEATGTLEEKVLLSAGVGANFFPINANISPYIGGNAGVAYGIGPTDDGVGFDLGASAGLLLFRLADTQVNIEAKTQWTLTEIEGDDFPFRYIGRVGILF